MKKTVFLMALSSIALTSGCASDYDVAVDNFDRSLHQLSTLDDAISVFGLPSDSKQMSNLDVYYWRNKTSAKVTNHDYNYKTNEWTSRSEFVPVECEIAISTKHESSTITHRQYSGGSTSCYPFVVRLEQWHRAMQARPVTR